VLTLRGFRIELHASAPHGIGELPMRAGRISN
jgi:hypothetical protein